MPVGRATQEQLPRATQEAKAEMVFSGSNENSGYYSSILLERISTHPCAGIPDKSSIFFTLDGHGQN
jgi:hypothetical protein